MKKFYFLMCYTLLSIFSVESMADTIRNLTITGHPYMKLEVKNLSFKNKNDFQSKLRSALTAKYEEKLKGLFISFSYNGKPLVNVDIFDKNKFPNGSHITFEYKNTREIVAKNAAAIEKALKEDDVIMAEKMLKEFITNATYDGYVYLIKAKIQNLQEKIDLAKGTSKSYKEYLDYQRNKNMNNDDMLSYATEELETYEPYIRQKLHENNSAEARRVFDSLKEAMIKDSYFDLVQKEMNVLEKEIIQKEKE